ncbi:phosphopantetheine-binding protein [Marinobacter sp. LN3S78]|uniref:phosphopantetheine-binding protein n=1 Tax=Marinobacter sp. LN3S78 TaxID=3382300 RepID=UPI00387B734C
MCNDDVISNLCAIVANAIDMPESDIDIDLPPSAYGLDSKSIIFVVQDMEKFLGIELDPEIFVSGCTMQQISTYIHSTYISQDFFA